MAKKENTKLEDQEQDQVENNEIENEETEDESIDEAKAVEQDRKEVAKKFLKFRAKESKKNEPLVDKHGNKIKVKEEVEIEEQAEPPKTHPSAAAGASKMAMVSALTNSMAAMSKSEMEDFFNKTMSSIGNYGQKDNSKANAASVKAKGSPTSAKNAAMKEDVSELFEGETLSEEFKEKALTLFEAVVSSRVAEIELELQEEYETLLNEELDVIREELEDKVASHLDFVTESWYKDNKIAIESQVKTDILTAFFDEIKETFLKYNIEIPEDKVDVVETLNVRVSELENELNETINTNIKLQKALSEVDKETVFYTVAEGLSAVQLDRFRKLSEGVEFKGDIESYEKKLNIVKEFAFKDKSKKVVKEETQLDGIDLEESVEDVSVKKYAEALSNSFRRV